MYASRRRSRVQWLDLNQAGEPNSVSHYNLDDWFSDDIMNRLREACRALAPVQKTKEQWLDDRERLDGDTQKTSCAVCDASAACFDCG